MNENARIYDQTLADINRQVGSGYNNLGGILSRVERPTATDPSQYLNRMDAGYASGLGNLGFMQQEMGARQNMLAPMYDTSNQRMANAYGTGLGYLRSGYNTARSAIDSAGATGRAGVQNQMAAGQAGINNLMQDVKNAGFMMSPTEKAEMEARLPYIQRAARVEARDQYNEFMNRRR